MNDIFEKPETMQENEHPRFYTAESVMRGHPDKLCDLIADSVLDACLQHDPASRVACEVMATHGHIIVAGEITTKVKPDVFNIVRDVLQDVGYDPKAYQIDCYIHDQSPDIAGAVEPELAEGEDEDTLGAGDQGVMVGYACNETPEYLPMPVVAAQRLVTLLEISRMTGVIPDIGPDGKVQVTMEYNGDTPVRITTVVVSVQHKEDTDIVCGGYISGNSCICGSAILNSDEQTRCAPMIGGNAHVYGELTGNVVCQGGAVVLPGVKLYNTTADCFVLKDDTVSVVPAQRPEVTTSKETKHHENER